MTPERRAVLLLLGLAVGGQALRAWLGRPDAPAGEIALLPVPAGTASAALAHRDSGLALSRPLASGEKVDIDRAPAIEIARLPRIGLRLAKVIVADREAKGPFGSAEALDRVSGIGPALIAAIREHAVFSQVPTQPMQAAVAPPEASGSAAPAQGPQPLDLNRATAQELERLPRIGPSLAARIVAFRLSHGPFRAVDSLIRVPGIGPATLALLRHRLTVQ